VGKRYREFKRITLTPPSARRIVELLVDLTYARHYGDRGKAGCEDEENCICKERGSLDVAKMIDSNITIGKKRARIDIYDTESSRCFATRLRWFSCRAGKSSAVFERVADEIDGWLNRAPLERIAEAGSDLTDG